MKNQIDQSLLKFAKAQQPVADPFKPTSKRDWALFILLSPLLALGGWVFLLILCMKEGN
jgi:hypothetical protein